MIASEASVTALPKLLLPLDKWELFPGTFVVGNRELDRYVKVPATAVTAVIECARLMDGGRTVSEIASRLGAAPGTLDVQRLCCRLREAGLLEGSKYKSELERSSFKWASFNFGPQVPAWDWTRIAACAFVFSCLVSMAGVAAVLLFKIPGELFVRPITGWYATSSAIVGTILSIAIHEAGHALAGLSNGLPPRRLRLLGYLGVIPYIVLTIPGIYTIPPRKRMQIWAAGPLASLALGLAAFGLVAVCPALGEPARLWLVRMGVGNAMVALWNCCPLIPSDGYFIASTMARQANWRMRSWREVAACIRQRRRPQLLLFAYGWMSLLGLTMLALRSVQHILRVTGFSWIGYAAVSLLLAITLSQIWGARTTNPGERDANRKAASC